MSRRFDSSGGFAARIVAWLFSAIVAHPEVRDELIDTAIQRRPAVYFACVTVMVMSATAALVTREAWAFAWLAIDFALVSYRLYLSFRYDDGVNRPERRRGAVIASMFALFIIFGLGCALSIALGPPVLMLVAIISALAVFAGVNGRWAAFPRLGVVTIVAIAVPVCGAIVLRGDGTLMLAAVQFAAVAAMLAAQTMQNHRSLMRMILAEQQNASLARCDPLTGLGNRMRLREHLEAVYAAGGEAGPIRGDTALLYLDLDGFKAFNDTHGHDAGDDLLRRVGEAIREAAGSAGEAAPEGAPEGSPGGAGVYRIGGDEFVVIQSGQSPVSAARLAERIIGAVPAIGDAGREPRRSVGVSIGIAFAHHADGPAALLARADEALYAAKREGKSRCLVAERGGVARARAA